jgi:hypothetical protein
MTDIVRAISRNYDRAFKITGFVVLCKFRQVATPINQFRLSFFFFFL